MVCLSQIKSKRPVTNGLVLRTKTQKLSGIILSEIAVIINVTVPTKHLKMSVLAQSLGTSVVLRSNLLIIPNAVMAKNKDLKKLNSRQVIGPEGWFITSLPRAYMPVYATNAMFTIINKLLKLNGNFPSDASRGSVTFLINGS